MASKAGTAQRRGRPPEAKRRVAWETVIACKVEPFKQLMLAALDANETDDIDLKVRAWDKVCSYLYAKPKQIDATLHVAPDFKIEIGGDDVRQSTRFELQ